MTVGVCDRFESTIRIEEEMNLVARIARHTSQSTTDHGLDDLHLVHSDLLHRLGRKGKGVAMLQLSPEEAKVRIIVLLCLDHESFATNSKRLVGHFAVGLFADKRDVPL